MENFFDCRKFPWLQKNNSSNNFETIKAYILNLEQKLNSLAFFAVDKSNIIFSRILKHTY